MQYGIKHHGGYTGRLLIQYISYFGDNASLQFSCRVNNLLNHNFLFSEFDKEQLHLYFIKLFKKYGPLVKIKAPGEPATVLVLRPADCMEVLQHTMKNPVRTPMGSLRKARYDDPFYEKKAGVVTE